MNPKYKANKKNKGKIPKIQDKRVMYVPIACGKCAECRRAKAREWRVRLEAEFKSDHQCYFTTLTFSNEAMREIDPKDELSANEFASRAIELFRKRWYKFKKKGVKHWLVTELGHGKRSERDKLSTHRVHLHGFIWINEEEQEDFKRIWKYGLVDFGEYVNSKSISYCVKYVSKVDEAHPNFQSKILTSKGIGKDFLKTHEVERKQFKGDQTEEYYRCANGQKIPLPIYYRNKIYNEEERELLWINKLNKQKRYVMGQEIDISTNEGVAKYLQVREYQADRTEKLGYPKQPWSKKKYKKCISVLEFKNKDV